jgi:hypothetical protein
MEEDNRIVRFYDEAVIDMAKSEDAKRPIYTDMVLCEIKFVGEPGKSQVAPANEMFKMMPRTKSARGTIDFARGGMVTYAEAWPKEWAAYVSKAEARGTGTPLEHLPFIRPAKKAELNYLNIHTAEQLASIKDPKLLGMGGRDLVEQAKAWVGEAEAKAVNASVLAEKAAMEERIAKLEAALAQRAAPASDMEAWSDDELKAHLAANGVKPRANASRETLLDAARQLAPLITDEVAA